MVAITLEAARAQSDEPRILTFRNHENGRLDLSGQVVFGTHRSGWQFALEQLKGLHNTEGTLFDGFLERRFGWRLRESVERGILPYTRPWVGVLHNPPDMPGFYANAWSPRGLMDNHYFQQSLHCCRGLFVLSDYLANWLAERVDVPVVGIRHPTELHVPGFSPEEFLASDTRRIVQSGFWLRKFHSLKHLPLESCEKVCIVPHADAKEYRSLEENYASRYNAYGEEVVGDYREIDWLPPREYDRLLKSSLVFLDLYDSSANNAIIECIARNTPLLVNALPAVVEYLGPEYPLYFENLEDAADKAMNDTLVLDAHRYLVSMDKSILAPDTFRDSIVNSSIYQALPSPKAGRILSVDNRPPVDTLDRLNIVRGRPLSNDWVFVVCFRNVGWKLTRCIESILAQNRCHDFGIVLVDDASGDSAASQVEMVLEEEGIPYVLVVNPERRYFTRNLYNAVNLLIGNDESVIIELDGDDYLEDTDVLGVLAEAYGLGAIKTFGRFRCVPEDSGFADSVASCFTSGPVNDMTRPWDLDACVAWAHLKSYKKQLFMKVPLVYFWERQGGNWLRMAEDLVVHPKMVELARYRTAYIEDVLYVYDVSGEQHDRADPEQARYLLENLYKLPYGRFIHDCRRRLRKSDARDCGKLLASAEREGTVPGFGLRLPRG